MLRRYVEPAMRRAGLHELDVQGLRHTFASIMLELYPIAKVNRWLGHANSEVTMKIYAHFVKTNDRSDTMDRLSTAVFAGEKQADEKSVRHEGGCCRLANMSPYLLSENVTPAASFNRFLITVSDGFSGAL